jgi:amino acid transporter/nucleotide-binding universal stress UspA family protein
MSQTLEGLGFEAEVRLSREMSVFSVTMIGVGAMIGAGIFVLTGIAAGVAGPALILAFGLNGVVTLFTAMAYAELGSCFHDAGGGYLWVKEGLPQPNGFLSGWMSWFAHAVACSLYSLGFGAYSGHVLREAFGLNPEFLPFSLDKTLAVVACLLFAYINFRGASETGKMGNVVTIAKVSIIGLFIAFGAAVIAHKTGWQANFRPFMPTGLSGVFMAMGLTFIAFQGYEVIAQCSEEVVDPKRNIPRAVFYALAVVIPIYLLVAFTALGGISGEGMPTWQYLGEAKEIAMVEAARQFMPAGAVVFLIGGLLSTVSALNATIYSSSRVAFAMGRDANLPDFFSRVHPRRHTPHYSIMASVAIVAAMAVLLPIEDVASAADLMFLFIFMQVNVVVIRLRKRRPDLDRGFRIPFMPLVPILGIITQIFIAGYLIRYSPKAFVAAAAWVLIGVFVHYNYASKKEAHHIVLRRAIERLVRRDYRILVALGDPNSVKSLMGVAIALAKHYDGEIVAMAVVEVPFQTPLVTAASLPEVRGRRNSLKLAEHLADDAEVPCRRLIKLSHRVSEGVLEAAQEEECNFIILGRSPRPRLASKLVMSSMHKVLRDAPCHVAVVKGDPPERAEHVLVPLEEDRNSRLALDLAPALADRWGAEPLILPLVPGGPGADLQASALYDRMRSDTGQPSGIQVEALASDGLVRRIVERAGEKDVIVMGEVPWTGFARMLAPAVCDEIAEKSPQMVILVKAFQARRKRPLLFRLLTGA